MEKVQVIQLTNNTPEQIQETIMRIANKENILHITSNNDFVIVIYKENTSLNE